MKTEKARAVIRAAKVKVVRPTLQQPHAVHVIAHYTIGTMMSKCGAVIYRASTNLEEVTCAECLQQVFVERRSEVNRAEKELLDVFSALVRRAGLATEKADSLQSSMEQWRRKAHETQMDFDNYRLDQQLARKRKRKRAK